MFSSANNTQTIKTPISKAGITAHINFLIISINILQNAQSAAPSGLQLHPRTTFIYPQELTGKEETQPVQSLKTTWLTVITAASNDHTQHTKHKKNSKKL